VGKLAWKDCRRIPEELVVAHNTTKRPIREEAKCYNKQRMHTYYYGKRIGMIMRMYAWHGKK
jgi:hypothetical protein